MKKIAIFTSAVLFFFAVMPYDGSISDASVLSEASASTIPSFNVSAYSTDVAPSDIPKDAASIPEYRQPLSEYQIPQVIGAVANAQAFPLSQLLPAVRSFLNEGKTSGKSSSLFVALTEPVPLAKLPELLAPNQAASSEAGITYIDPSKPMLALTFDDGPSAHTYRILDLLDEYGGRVTFCVVGYLVDGRKDVVKRASDMGCEVIGHSWDHKQLTKLGTEALTSQLVNTKNVIEAAIGKSTYLYRPPYGAVNDHVKNVSRDLGYSLIYWSVDTLDWKTRNANAVYKAVMKGAGDKAIILLHDLHKTTVDAMERVIPELLAQGYQLVTVSELLQYSGVEVVPGTVYYRG